MTSDGIQGKRRTVSQHDGQTLAAWNMREDDLVQSILQLARLFGYLAYHTNNSQRSETGFPDLVMVGHGRIIAVECKSESGVKRKARPGRYRMLPGQQDWLTAFRENGAVAYEWRPSDWLSGEIERVLRKEL